MTAMPHLSAIGSDWADRMQTAVASAVPLYLVLDALHLLDTRSGLVLVYASTAVPFAIFVTPPRRAY